MSSTDLSTGIVFKICHFAVERLQVWKVKVEVKFVRERRGIGS